MPDDPADGELTDGRPILRLGLAPVLLLGWNMAHGELLPFLAPSLLAMLLAGSATRPTLKTLVGAIVLVSGVTWVMDLLFTGLAASPGSAWIILLALATLAFARLAQRPDDVPSTLTLIAASLVVLLGQVATGLGAALPWAMGHAVLQAAAATLIAHALLPSPPRPEPARPGSPGATRADVVQAFGRSLALVALLAMAIGLEDNSAVLVALTGVAILASPVETAARGQSGTLLLTNAVAAALILPLLLVAALRPDPLVLFPLALAGSLYMASGLGMTGRRRVLARAGMPVLVALLGVLLPKAGAALPLLVDRLLTLGLVMLYALAVLALLRPARAR